MSPIVRFDLNLLLSLEALLSERHVTRAAERLYVTQPTMSGMLQRLRDQFGDPLLVRVGREMELTPKAEALRAPLQDALRTIRELMATQPRFEPVTTNRLFKIIMSDYFTFVYLPHLMAFLGTHAPGIQLQIEPLSNSAFELVDSGEVDIAITSDNWQLLGGRYSENFLSMPLFTDRLVCITSQTHAPEDLTEEEFRRRRHAILRVGRNTQSIEEAALTRADIDIESSVLISSFPSLISLVAATSLIATVPNRLAIKLGEPLGVKIHEPPFDVPLLTEAMTWHLRNENDPAHAWLRSAMIDCARNF